MEGLNTTLGNIASAIEELYNNGRVVPSDEKLVYEDFLQYVYTFYGDVASIQYYKELRTGNQDFYFANGIERIEVDINSDSKNLPPFIELETYALLPYLSGIVSVYPFTESSLRNPDYDYLKLPPGGESLYGKPKVLDDLGLKFFVPKGNRLELWGNDGDKKVFVEYIPFNEDTEIPSQIGAIITQEVIKLVLPASVRPTDTHEDTDPNQATYKQRLDQPQSI